MLYCVVSCHVLFCLLVGLLAWTHESHQHTFPTITRYITTQLPLWLGSLDPDSGVPSYWSFWGYDYASQRGLGNYYGANDITLVQLIVAYVLLTRTFFFDRTGFPSSFFVHSSYSPLAVNWRMRGLVDDSSTVFTERARATHARTHTHTTHRRTHAHTHAHTYTMHTTRAISPESC
jgi:hypothetical protein